MKYKCPWCGNEFELEVRTVPKITRDAKGNAGSTQVQCKVCKNFLKTWQ